MDYESEKKSVLCFEEDFLMSEVFSFAITPDFWYEGHYIAEIDPTDVIEALEDSADRVDVEVTEGHERGPTWVNYEVFAKDVESFRVALTKRLLDLLESRYGKEGENQP